jgi:TP901 family phage tail tape measure protein
MARIELNIVALGDFSSVDAQIKALQAQVVALNKNIAGVGLSSNLTKELNSASAAFSNTLLSTGQFTKSTVQLTTETQKFGQALEKGKLSLKQYYDIVSKNSGSATNSVKQLAIEQTKLQNSVIMSDPSKKGFYSVFTPTTINQIADATKIAANQQNIYNIAVNKGTQELINWGKNTQWAGRQLTVGLSVPLMIFGNQAATTFKELNEQLVRLQKVYGNGIVTPSKTEIDSISKDVTNLAKTLASSMGVAVKDTAAMAADLAATGKTGNDLVVATREAMRLSKLGELDTQAAMQATVSLQNVYKLSTEDLTKSINFLNAVENQTSTSLQDLVDGIPRVGPIVQQLGGSFKDTAVMMVAMKEAGVPAAQSANAIKSALASLINPTKAARDAFGEYNINLAGIAKVTNGNPVQMFLLLQKALKDLEPLAQSQLIEKLFGKFQQARIQALVTNLGAATSQTKTAFDLMSANSEQLSTLAEKEMKTATESVSGKYKIALETFRANLIPVGEKIVEITTSLLNFGNSVADVFGKLPGPMKSILGIAAIGTVFAGPIIMLTGLMANFIGYITKAVFNLKQLATGGKTLGQLLTPEIIASQQAAQLFGTGILNDVEAVSLLNQAIKNLTVTMQGLVGTMEASAGLSAVAGAAATRGVPNNLRNPFRPPGMAAGGYVPGTGNTDSFPALLMPGEAVIPKGPAQQYQSFISSMIDGKLPKFEEGTPYAKRFGNIFGPNAKQFESKTYLGGGSTNEGYLSNVTGTHNLIMQQIAERKAEAEALKNIETAGSAPLRFYGGTRNGQPTTERPAELQGAAQMSLEMHGLPGERDKLQAIVEAAIAKYDLTGSQASNISGDHLLNLGHVQGAEYEEYKGAKRKVWEASNLRTTSGAENKGFEYLNRSGPLGDSFRAALGNTFGAKEPGGAEAAAAIAAGKQPLTKLEQSIFIQAINALEYQVSRGALKNYPALKTAYVARDVMQARVSGNQGLTQDLSTLIISDKVIAQATAKNKAAGKKIGAAVEQGVKEQLGIRSPSTKGILIGESIDQGIKIGLEKGAPQVYAEAEKIGASTYESMAKESTGNGRFSRLRSLAMKPNGGMNMLGRFGTGSAMMMAAPMLTSMLPQNAATNAISTTSSFAGMGMMFGGYGAAAGAAIGLATSGIKLLIEMEKQHKAEATATFTASASAVKMFGGAVAGATTPTGNLDSVLDSLLPKTQKTVDAVQSFVTEINKLKKDDPMSIILKKVKDASDSDSAGKIARAFATTQMAINGMNPEQAQKMIDLYMAAAGYSGASVQAPTTESATKKFLDNANKETYKLIPTRGGVARIATGQEVDAKAVKDLVNVVTTASPNFAQYKSQLDGIAASKNNTVQATQKYASAIRKENPELATNIVSLAKMKLNLSEITPVLTLMSKNPKSPLLTQVLEAAQKGDTAGLAKGLGLVNTELEKLFKLNPSGVPGTPPVPTGYTDPSAKVTAKYKDLINFENKRISLLEKTNTLMNQQNQAAQDAIDLATKQTDLQGQIRKAIAGGDYLQANMLRQQMTGNVDAYNQKIVAGKNDTTISTLRQQLADFQDQLAQGKDPGKKAAAQLKANTLAASIEKYQVGSVTMPSAVSYGPTTQLGSSSNNVPAINVVVNANGLSPDQATIVARNAIEKALSDAGIKASASARKTSVGGK